jgi:hypothetical protein
MIRRARRLLVAAVAGVVLVSVPSTGAASAQDAADGPRVTLDRVDVGIGEPIIATVTGFTSQQVTVAVCGNLAKRGSADCNMPLAQSERVRDDRAATLTQVFAEAPPMPCPCLVLAYSPTTDEFAVASINLIGHPTAPVVDPEGAALVEVEVSARRAGGGVLGWARSSLGGPTIYEVTVSVRNVSTGPLDDIELQGSAVHRFDDDAAILELEPPPAPLEPGQTWEQTVEAEVHPPAAGRYAWTVVASGAAAPVTASTPTSNVPVLLYLFAIALVVDLVVIVWRLRRRSQLGGNEPGAWDEPEEPETWEEIQARWAEDAAQDEVVVR